MYQPETTYRIQFHKHFNFDDFEKIIPYLHKLGIKTIYASPIFEAVPGSMHGYDGLNPNAINPEIGTLEQLRNIRLTLRSLGMGWLQDFVPNHMAYSPQNKWLCDFLEKGKMSIYNEYFDKNPDEPLMAPFLGSTLDEVLEREEINIVYSLGKLQLQYFDSAYPLNYTGYYDILSDEIFDGKGFADVRSQVDLLSQVTDKNDFQLQWEVTLASLAEKLKDEITMELFKNGLKKISRDRVLLKRLIDVQFYRLCEWREANVRINYRRFFTINGLICLRMEREEVFNDYHRLLNQLIKEDIIQGIRIDHVDGLYDPTGYLQQLRAMVGSDVYIVVEKILERQEALPLTWPVEGTTGYDFLAQVNNAMTDVHAEVAFTGMYHKMVTPPEPVDEMIYRYKQLILDQYMGGELNNLCTQFLALTANDFPPNITAEQVKTLISELLVCCPVYRYYPDVIPFDQQNREQFAQLIETVRERRNVDTDALNFVLNCFTDEVKLTDQEYAATLLHFWKRCMQLSGPLMAKGVEDTLMYNYQRLLSHNDVGNSPAAFGLTTNEFHQLMKGKMNAFPLSMNATSTHDTKRGEDSRARLQLLSTDYKEWFDVVKRMLKDPEPARSDLSVEDRYFVIQVVYAALDFGENDGKQFNERLKAFLVKAAREAKQHSGWDDPDEQYEDRLFQYALTITDPKTQAGRSLHNYLKARESEIVMQSLAQLTLKCICPGVPDIYQGTEFWDLSFVDPDNRTLIHYNERIAALESIAHADFKISDITKNATDPVIKLFCLYQLLQLRKRFPDVFERGLYEPLEMGDNYLSFVRRYKGDWVIVVVPLGGKIKDKDLSIELPMEAPLRWRNIFTGAILERSDMSVVHELNQFPVMVLQSEMSGHNRSAGILLPLFSLPSPYGIGDMGVGASDFISFLSKSGQKLWQILPLNPVLETNCFSPYACSSAFAGDPMYIDPKALVPEGWLKEEDILFIEVASDELVDYTTVRNNKMAILQIAWRNFKAHGTDVLKNKFNRFCEVEKEWLVDYALYAVLKEEFKGKPWYEWPEVFRDRSENDIRLYRDSKQDELDWQQWLQFIFYKQWYTLKSFAEQHHVKLVGDIPFYMGSDSADVWANKALFNIEASGKLLYIAGVPPDYFSRTGQLWGMPTYRWESHKGTDYSWWIRRLKQNIKLYDLVRLDHFRAFYDYWEIPGNADTAIHGTWKKGPQDELFQLIRKHFPDMPFIAEDLGEIHRGVFDFKDKYQLPGMRILQFGFEHYDGRLRDLPHNFDTHSIVYTGTHDNNTTLGWFKCLKADARQALNDYFGYEVTEDNINDSMLKMACSTVAENLIIPMQDVLGLDGYSRINTPSTVVHNWRWRMLPGKLTDEVRLRLLQYVRRYNRL